MQEPLSSTICFHAYKLLAAIYFRICFTFYMLVDIPIIVYTVKEKKKKKQKQICSKKHQPPKFFFDNINK